MDYRDDFAHGGLTYLNNASTSPMPHTSIRAVSEFLEAYSCAGPDSERASEMIEKLFASVRSKVSNMINCRPDELVMTQSVTDGVNAVASGLGSGSRIIVRGMEHEHHANLYPWIRAGQIHSLPIDRDGFFQMADLEREAVPGTRLVALSHALYNTGAILPVEGAGRLLRGRGVPYFVDSAQTAGATDLVDVEKIGCDFMAFNGSKWLCGPMGTGVFYCRRGSARLLEPVSVGGDSAELGPGGQLRHKEMPDRFQAGFRNYAGLAGLDASLEYMLRVGLDRVRSRISRLAGILREELASSPGVSVLGPADPGARTSIVPFTLEGREPADVVSEMQRKHGVVLAVREAGDRKLVRASPHIFNTEEEMARTARLLG